MNGRISNLPDLLPSRRRSQREAASALEAGSPILIVGDLGSGRTTFALGLFRSLGKHFYWITGAKALKDVPFAALTLLCAQIPKVSYATQAPTQMIAALTMLSAEQKIWILLDHADQVDDQSAAVLAQLTLTGQVGLVMVASSSPELPASLSQLSTFHHAYRADMAAIDHRDATSLLSGVLNGPVNSSSVTSLLEHSGGNPLHFREIVYDAQEDRALRPSAGYWTLTPGWQPKGQRLTDLTHARLAAQPKELRETVEVLSIIGEVPLMVARKFLSQDQLDRAFDAGLIWILNREPAHDTKSTSKRVSLGPGLVPHIVVATLGRARSRELLEQLRSILPPAEMDERTSSSITLHCMNMGLEVTCEDLARAVEAASRSRQFISVIALTEQVAAARPESPMLNKLLTLRAEAQHEIGNPEAALGTLELLRGSSDPYMRLTKARIHYEAYRELEVAERLLAPLPDDPVELSLSRLLIQSRAHQKIDVAQLLIQANNEDQDIDLRMAAFAEYSIRLTYQGRPGDALEVLQGVLESEHFAAASPTGRGELLVGFHPALLNEGSKNLAVHHRLGLLDWKELSISHTNFLASQAAMELDQGNATAALELVSQAMSLAGLSDPYSITGFLAAFRASATVLLGDDEQAKTYYDMARSAHSSSGMSLGHESDRVLLPVVLRLEGKEAAMSYLNRLLAKAERSGNKMITLRLLHDAWRSGLQDDPAALSQAASQVQGRFAQVIAGYAAALSAHDDQLLDLCQQHVTHGRLLYAAELANRGAEQARTDGQRTRTSMLLNLCADHAQSLTNVNTPALGRARVDERLLTEREYAACIRAAQGESNAAIAAALYLSPRTVEGHLQRAYTKLGIRDRRQLLVDTNAQLKV